LFLAIGRSENCLGELPVFTDSPSAYGTSGTRFRVLVTGQPKRLLPGKNLSVSRAYDSVMRSTGSKAHNRPGSMQDSICLPLPAFYFWSIVYKQAHNRYTCQPPLGHFPFRYTRTIRPRSYGNENDSPPFLFTCSRLCAHFVDVYIRSAARRAILFPILALAYKKITTPYAIADKLRTPIVAF